ncbi:unnamed protein product, partial [Owenia fusiformis]
VLYDVMILISGINIQQSHLQNNSLHVTSLLSGLSVAEILKNPWSVHRELGAEKGISVPYSGIQFLSAGRRCWQCHQGPDKDKSQKERTQRKRDLMVCKAKKKKIAMCMYCSLKYPIFIPFIVILIDIQRHIKHVLYVSETSNAASNIYSKELKKVYQTFRSCSKRHM